MQLDMLCVDRSSPQMTDYLQSIIKGLHFQYTTSTLLVHYLYMYVHAVSDVNNQRSRTLIPNVGVSKNTHINPTLSAHNIMMYMDTHVSCDTGVLHTHNRYTVCEPCSQVDWVVDFICLSG